MVPGFPLGIYDGVISQILASGPYVVQQHALYRGNAANGYGWFNTFGFSYGLPRPLVLLSSSYLGQNFQGLYNHFTDGVTAFNGCYLQRVAQQRALAADIPIRIPKQSFRFCLPKRGWGTSI